MHHYKIVTSRGQVAAHVMAPESFDGEHERHSWLYLSGAWFVSVLAMATNVGQALLLKLVRGGAWTNVVEARPRSKARFQHLL